jgi:hypothetical protein
MASAMSPSIGHPLARLTRLTLPALVAFAIVGLARPATVPAAAPVTGAYQVEVIIFRAVEPPANEDLAEPAEGRGFDGPLERGGTPPTILRMLDVSQMQLGGLATRLRSSGSWRVLAHTAWVQTATDWPHHDGLALADLGINAPGLSGSLYLERGPQYLHLGVDLHLGRDPAWSLSELRKVKYNEKNYFDHPGFGVIAIISPAKRGADQ